MSSDAGTVVATLHPGTVSAVFTDSIAALSAFENSRDGGSRITRVEQRRAGVMSIADARNNVTAEFLDDPARPEWLLWIDSDMGFGGNLLDRLLASADRQQRPIVGALCFGWRVLGNGPLHEPFGRLFPTLYRWNDEYESFENWKEVPANQVVRVDGTGAACLLIHRDALSRMTEPRKNSSGKPGGTKDDRWWSQIRCTSRYAASDLFGEDMSFCLRAEAAEIPLHVDTSIQTAHDNKQRPLTLESYDRQQRTLPDVLIVLENAKPESLLQGLERQGEAENAWLVANETTWPRAIAAAGDLDWLTLRGSQTSPEAGLNDCLDEIWARYGPWCNLVIVPHAGDPGPRLVSALTAPLRSTPGIGMVVLQTRHVPGQFGVVPIPSDSGLDTALLDAPFALRGDVAGWLRPAVGAGLQEILSALAARDLRAVTSADSYLLAP